MLAGAFQEPSFDSHLSKNLAASKKPFLDYVYSTVLLHEHPSIMSHHAHIATFHIVTLIFFDPRCSHRDDQHSAAISRLSESVSLRTSILA